MLSKRMSVIIVLLFAAALVLAGCGSNKTPQNKSGNNNENKNEPVLSGEELVNTRCNQCHSLDRVTRQRDDSVWQEQINRMLQKSPDLLTEEESQRLLQYLQENY